MNLAPVDHSVAAEIVEATGPDARQLELFDAWTTVFVDTVAVEHRQTIGTYLRWGLRRRLGQAAATGKLRPWSTLNARQQARVAVDFLDWLTARDTTLEACAQGDLDHWFSAGTTTRKHNVHFLKWAIQHRLCDRRLRVVDIRSSAPTPMPADERRPLIARLINDDTIALEERVAGLLVVLYAQPASRITRLQVDDVHQHHGCTELVIADNPIELLAPVDRLIAELATRTVTSRWLFPGQNPGQPLSPKSLGQRLLRLGITRAARVAALHDLIREIPAPVLGHLIGYNPNFIADRAATLAVPYATYPQLRQRT